MGGSAARRNEWLLLVAVLVASLAGIGGVAASTAHLSGWRLLVVLLLSMSSAATLVFVLQGSSPAQIWLREHRVKEHQRLVRRSFRHWFGSDVVNVNGPTVRHLLVASAPNEEIIFEGREILSRRPDRDYLNAEMHCVWKFRRREASSHAITFYAPWAFAADIPNDFDGSPSLDPGRHRFRWFVDGDLVLTYRFRIKADGAIIRSRRTRLARWLNGFRAKYWPEELPPER